MSITHKLLISAITLSAAVGIGISTVQPAAHVSARRTYRVTRYHTGYYRRGVWHTYKSGYYNRYWRWVPNRAKRAKRTWRHPRYRKAVRRAIQPRKRTRDKHHLKLYKFTVDGIQDQAYGYKNYRKALAEDTKVDYNYDKGCDPDDPWFVNYVKTHSPKQTHHTIKQSTDNNQPIQTPVNKNQPTQQPISQPTNNSQNQDNNLDSTYNPSPEANATVEKIAEQRSIQDINNDRVQNGLQPLTNTPQMQQIAEIRAKQAQTNYNNGHIDPTTGQGYANEIGQQLGYGKQEYGENMNNEGTGCTTFDDNQSCGNHTSNGEELADNNNNGILYHDQGSNNGHLYNVMDKYYSQVGVGVNGRLLGNYNGRPYYNYTIIEDFKLA